MAVSGYDGIHLIYEALKKTNGDTDGTKLVEAMKGQKWESPRGPISIDPETRDIIQNVYIRKVEKVDGELYNVEFADLRGRQGSRQDQEVTPNVRHPRGCSATSPACGRGRRKAPGEGSLLWGVFVVEAPSPALPRKRGRERSMALGHT